MTVEDSDDALLTDVDTNNDKENHTQYGTIDTGTGNIQEKAENKDAVIENENETEKVTGKGKCLTILKSFTVEPFMFLFMVSYVTKTVCTQNLFIDKACLTVFLFPANVCKDIDNYTNETKSIEAYANNYNLYFTLIQTVPAAFFSLVVGSWSDKYGRKLPVYLSIIGSMLENVAICLNIVYFDAPIYFLLLSAIPAGISGGLVSVLLCVYSTVSEQTTRKKRTIKYALLELGFGLGIPLATFQGGIIYKQFGYLYVYITALAFQVVSVIWFYFMIKETVIVEKRFSWTMIRDFFRLDNFKESYRAVLRRREGYVRAEIIVLIVSICVLVITFSPSSTFGYYYVRWMYKWDVSTYSNVSTIFMSCGMVLTVIAIPLLMRIAKVGDPFFGTVGSITMCISNIIKGVAYAAWLYYIGCAFQMFTGMSILATRSRLSKIVQENELGKIFAFVASCESLIPCIASVLFTQIFNSTIDFFPGMAYVFIGVLLIFPTVSFLWISRRKPLNYQLLVNHPDIPKD